MRRTHRALVALTAALCLGASSAQAATYVIQPEQSRVRFEVGHHDYTRPVRGSFGSLSGEIDYDPARAEVLAVEVAIDSSSVDTDNRYRDSHLRSKFFESDKYPTIHFVATRLVLGESPVVEGELTIKGVTRRVSLEISGLREVSNAAGTKMLRCRASARINRREFGVVASAEADTAFEAVVAQLEEGLDEFIEDDVEIAISVVAYGH